MSWFQCTSGLPYRLVRHRRLSPLIWMRQMFESQDAEECDIVQIVPLMCCDVPYSKTTVNNSIKKKISFVALKFGI